MLILTQVCSCLFLFLASCTSERPLTTYHGTTMTIDFHIVVDPPLPEVDAVIQQVFSEVNQIYNKWNSDSELSLFNRHPSTTPLPLSPELYQLLTLTDAMVKMTGGRFDPTIEPVEQLWKDALERGQEPSPASIQELKPAIGWDKIHFDSRSIWKDHPLTSLDLGGIAKGYAVDLLFERLQKAGATSLYVEWGGEIRVSKSHPDGRPWKVGIAHSDEVLALSDEAVATSGDYVQFWPIGEKIYFHIIDPFTLKPLERTSPRINSSTVIAPTCTVADALAKIGLFFSTENEAREWAEPFQAYTFYFQETHD